MPMSRSPFRERLGMYLLGVAIGLMILGFIYMARQRAAQRRPPPSPQAPASPQR